MENYIAYFHKKYPHILMEELGVIEGRAKEILIHLLFKSSNSVSESQREYAYEHYKYWIYSCIQEMIDRLGIGSAIAYSENGISVKFETAQLSNELKNEIVPFIGVR